METLQTREGESGQAVLWEVTLSWQPSCLWHFSPFLIPPRAFPFLAKRRFLPPAQPWQLSDTGGVETGPRAKHIWGLGSFSLPKFELLTLFPEALGLFKQATVISFL